MTGRVFLVTGANKGIGLSTTRALCKLPGDNLVYLGSRNEQRGKEAVKLLEGEGLSPRLLLIDIEDDESVKAARDFLKATHGGLDVLVNNAGFAFNHDSQAAFAEQAEVTLRINYYGTKRVCNLLFPLLTPGARVVNVSSSCGKLSMIDGDNCEVLRAKFSDPLLTEADLDQLMDHFIELAKDSKEAATKAGYPSNTYRVAKVGVSALSILQQREMERARSGEDIAINHVHPGYVDTDMTSHKGPLTPEEGAASSVFAATLPPGTEIRGKYIWLDCSVKQWD